jgi:kinesin family protein 2/24
LYTFHEAISHLQEIEEEIVDYHKQFIDAQTPWMQNHKQLFKMSCEVDYDVDQYSMQLECLLSEKYEFVKQFLDKVRSFREQLAEEELISKKMVSH